MSRHSAILLAFVVLVTFGVLVLALSTSGGGSTTVLAILLVVAGVALVGAMALAFRRDASDAMSQEWDRRDRAASDRASRAE